MKNNKKYFIASLSLALSIYIIKGPMMKLSVKIGALGTSRGQTWATDTCTLSY